MINETLANKDQKTIRKGNKIARYVMSRIEKGDDGVIVSATSRTDRFLRSSGKKPHDQEAEAIAKRLLAERGINVEFYRQHITGGADLPEITSQVNVVEVNGNPVNESLAMRPPEPQDKLVRIIEVDGERR